MVSSYQKTEIAVGIFLLACCLFAFITIKDLPADAKMFPNLILGVMAICVCVALGRSILGISQKVQGKAVTDWQFFANVKRFIISVFIFSIYLLCIETIGFFVSSALLIVCMATFVGYRKYVSLAMSLIGFLVFVYLVFVLLFERPLPPEFFLSDIPVSRVMTEWYHV